MTKHSNDIQLYLEMLENEFQGQSASLVQDALYDVENHLIEMIRKNKDLRLVKIINEFGSPKEIASQYIQQEEDFNRYLYGTELNKPMVNGFFEPLTSFLDYRSLIYFFISFPLSIVYFGWTMLFGLPVLVLSIVMIGLPFLALFLKTQTYIALIEGQLLNLFLSIRMPRRPARLGQARSTFAQPTRVIWEAVKSSLSWRIMLYTTLHLPLSFTYFIAACVLFMGSLGLILSPLVDPIVHTFAPHLSVDINWYWLPITTIVGVIGATLSLHIARALSKLHSSIARYLLIQ